MVPCLAIFDTMKYIGSDVGTVGFGGCMGMSGFLLAVGKKARDFLLMSCVACLTLLSALLCSEHLPACLSNIHRSNCWVHSQCVGVGRVRSRVGGDVIFVTLCCTSCGLVSCLCLSGWRSRCVILRSVLIK